MKVSELVVRLLELNQDADVMFDTEAQTYDVHMVSIDEVWPISTEEIGREVVCLHERADYRVDNRDARIAEKDAEIARLTNALELADASEAAKDAELDRLRHEVAHPFDAEEVRAAYERGAREFAEWWDVDDTFGVTSSEALARFLERHGECREEGRRGVRWK
jgi:hypothetical protein